MKRWCPKCNVATTSLTRKKNKCWTCGGPTEKFRPKKLKDAENFQIRKDEN